MSNELTKEVSQETDKSIEIRVDEGNKEWTYRTEKGGITKRCTVKQVENGYTLHINKYGRPEGKEDAEYIDENKEFISKSNPLEAENIEEAISDAEAIGNIQQMKQALSDFNY